MRRFILVFILLFSSKILFANTILQTTVDKLNLRQAPHGKVLSKLKKATLVNEIEANDGWSKISYFDKNKKKITGWVSSDYLKVVEEKKSLKGILTREDCKAYYNTKAKVCVLISDINLKCKNTPSGFFVEECKVKIFYDVNTTYSGDEYLNATVQCSTNINYKSKDGFSSSKKSEFDIYSHRLYANDYSSSSLDINFIFNTFLEVSNVKIDYSDCEINSISKY